MINHGRILVILIHKNSGQEYGTSNKIGGKTNHNESIIRFVTSLPVEGSL